jgi:hypothetical protein
LFTYYLDGVFNLKKIEERPDEADDESCDDDEEEKVVVAESIVVESINGLGGGGAGHADDPKDLGREEGSSSDGFRERYCFKCYHAVELDYIVVK